tara:strand:- start:30760 stop:31038 length:279 start_codon:yes stop_codon:yes gene_type:complete
MDIKISIVLKDKTYGFSDLLDGRELNNQTKEEIIDLIREYIGYVFDQQIEVEQLIIPDVVSCVCKIPEPRLKVSENGIFSYCNNCSKTYWQK